MIKNKNELYWQDSLQEKMDRGVKELEGLLWDLIKSNLVTFVVL